MSTESAKHLSLLRTFAAAAAVLVCVQAALGLLIAFAEMGARWAHIVLGLLILVAGIALATLAHRKPGTALADRHV